MTINNLDIMKGKKMKKKIIKIKRGYHIVIVKSVFVIIKLNEQVDEL